MGTNSDDAAAEHERSDWGCIGCLFDELVVFPLAAGAALLVRSWLGWEELAWRDALLALGLVVVFWLLFIAVAALLRRRGTSD